VLVGFLALFACSHNDEENLPPMAAFVVSSPNGYAPFQVAFNASSSSDIDGRIVRYEWSFGDGATARGVQVEHVFADDGEYTVALSVQDNRGAEATATAVIEVLNPPPVAQFSYTPQEPIVGQVIRFSASTSYDPAALVPKTVTAYHWDFGDGNETTGVIVEHVYVIPAEYTVTLTITDDDGAEDITEAVVEIGLPAPPPPPG
jgi:PKD repeat protein